MKDIKSKQTLKNIGTWLVEGDTGTSSLSLCAVYLGSESKEISYPLDIGDFERCLGFLHKLSAEEVNPLLDKMAELNESWKGIRKNWDDLIFFRNKNDMSAFHKLLYKQHGEPKENEIRITL